MTRARGGRYRPVCCRKLGSYRYRPAEATLRGDASSIPVEMLTLDIHNEGAAVRAPRVGLRAARWGDELARRRWPLVLRPVVAACGGAVYSHDLQTYSLDHQSCYHVAL
jgi:hypothetical protein